MAITTIAIEVRLAGPDSAAIFAPVKLFVKATGPREEKPPGRWSQSTTFSKALILGRYRRR